jgi:hypothetical protein
MHIHNPNVPPPIEELRLSKLDKGMERGRYTWEKKYSVVAVYLQCGSLRETEAQTGVPSVTVSNWKQTSWWEDLANQIKTAEHTQLNNQLSKLIKKSLNHIDDALENGELILNNKTGEMVRKPVSVRDTTRVASELMQRQMTINKAIVETDIKKQTIEDTLKLLASEFSKMANSKPESEIIEMVDEVNEDNL